MLIKRGNAADFFFNLSVIRDNGVDLVSSLVSKKRFSHK